MGESARGDAPDARGEYLIDPAHCRAPAAALALLWALPIGAVAQTPMTSAYLDDFDAHKTTAALSDGENLAYIDTGPRDAPPLVLIHGYTDSARDWAPIAPLLRRRFRLIIPDLRGHGASGKPECCYTRFDFAYDVKLLLDSLHIARTDVAGHSLGSIVAQTFAEQWPHATRRLVLISSTGTSFGPARSVGRPAPAKRAADDWLASVAELADPIDPDSAFMREWWKVSIAFDPQFARRQMRDSAAIPARVWRSIADQSLIGVDLRTLLPRIEAPTLLIWGARDTLVSEAGRQALRSGIPHGEERTFASLGHDLFWEDPPAVARVMIGFLARN
jgi:pimeloyl-ACP methyl ester carboxylesterase